MKVVILAGGKGTRMGHLVSDVPKPMVLLAGKPIMEHQIDLAKRYGLEEFVVLTGYRADVLEDYFGDGSPWGVDISYRREDHPLGTAGGVKELEGEYGDRVKIFKMNVDESTSTPSKYGVRAIPTVLAFKGGDVVEQLQGARPKSAFEEMITKLL